MAYIPPFYRIFFTWIDPIIALHGAWTHFRDPDFILNAYIPREMSQRNPLHDMLMYNLGGGLLQIAIINGGLLRYSSDINVWKIVQAAILAYDIVILCTLYVSLDQQGRLSPTIWRPEDWGCWAITLSVGLARTLFIAGAGLNQPITQVKNA